MIGLCLWLVLYHIDSLGPLIGRWLSLTAGMFGTLQANTPGYIRAFDYFIMFGMMAYRVPRPVAAICASVVYLLLRLPLTIVGVGWLMAPKLNSSPASVDNFLSVASTP